MLKVLLNFINKTVSLVILLILVSFVLNKMSIKAHFTRDVVENSEEMKVHFIPATIDGNGTMKIDEYFNSYNTEQDGSKSIKY